MKGPNLYELLAEKVREIERELQVLKRWQDEPLPNDKFENMGAFGSNTMTFEQWIQFVLIPRIDGIVNNKDELPSESMLSTYAVRAFDGDPDAAKLTDLLYDIDQLINATPQDVSDNTLLFDLQPDDEEFTKNETVSLGDETIPTVIYSLADVLPQFEGQDLESQLETFDIFLGILSPSVRIPISELLRKAAERATNLSTRERIDIASKSVAQGKKAAEPWNN